MRYYLIYLNNGFVVDLVRFDDEESMIKQYHIANSLEDFRKHVPYDNLQIFRMVT